MAAANPSASFAIPQPLRGVIGICLFAGFLGGFVALGIYNLLHGVALVPSILWLSLNGVMLFGFCKERGSHQVLTEILGAFARQQFVWAFPTGTGHTEIRFGYQIFGMRRFYFVIPADRIESVNWSTGQASHMSGRDMDDWSVAVWYDHGDPALSQKHKSWRKPDQEVHIVGLTGSKSEVAASGHAFLNFLRESGVRLVPGENDCTFVRASVAG